MELVTQNYKGLNSLIRSRGVERTNKLKELLEDSPYQDLATLASRIDAQRGVIKNDIERLARNGFEPAIEWQDHFKHRSKSERAARKRVRELMEKNGLVEYSKLAEQANMSPTEFKHYALQIQNEEKRLQKRIMKMHERNKDVRDFFKENPNATVYEASIHTGRSAKQIIADNESLHSGEMAIRSLELQKQGAIDQLVDDMRLCRRCAEASIKIDPRTGSRWIEEGRKLMTLYADLTGMKKTADINIQINNTIKTKEERDAVIRAAEEDDDVKLIQPKVYKMIQNDDGCYECDG